VSADAAARVEAAFNRNFERNTEVGASVALWQDGREVLSLASGWMDGARTQPWTAETLVLVWSATKGLSSACVLHALDAAGLDLDTRVAAFWPAFAQGGKGEVTVGEVLSHRAGLSGLEDRGAQMLDYPAVVEAIEKQTPLWPRGEGHGYGPRSFGFLADEILRRLTQVPLGEYWRTHFAVPLDLEIWIGLPAEFHPRVAQMLAAKAGCGDAEEKFMAALADQGTLTHRAFSTPAAQLSASAMNSAALRSASLPSLGAIGTARALAKFYAVLAGGGRWDGRAYFSPRVLAWMQTPLTQGIDHTFLLETTFSAGFMQDPVDEAGRKKRFTFGPSTRAFGHPGAGGSLAFADPDTGLGFAYIMNQMEMGVLPRSRAVGLVQAWYDFP